MTLVSFNGGIIPYFRGMKSYVSIIVCTVLIMIACKKEELVGDSVILKGNWKWVSTDQVTNTCEHDSLWIFTAFDSSYTNNEFSVEFLEKGKIYFSHNGGVIVKNRIVFESKKEVVLDVYTLQFSIKLNNDEGDIMEGLVGANDLLLFDYPKDSDNSCETRYNYFVKE